VAEQAKGKWKTFKLEVITPERVVVKEEVEAVVVPSKDGLLGILRNHAPFIGALDIGVLKYLKDGHHRYIACNEGIFEMTGSELRILSDTAEPGEIIDVERAKEAQKRAEERLKQKSREIDVLRAELALRRALARQRAAEAASKQ
jgi:F-type H+-transporting ATPase subunit epsilon